MVTNRTKCLKYMIIPTNHSGVLKVTEGNLALRWNPRNNFNPTDPEQGSIILVQNYQKKKKKMHSSDRSYWSDCCETDGA